MRRLVVLALIAGCGAGAIDFADYRDELVDARCSYLVRCGLFATSADCRAYFDRTQLDDPNPAAAIDAGKVDYDGEAAQRCADALRSASCDATSRSSRELDESCTKIFTGSSAAGTACVFDAECESLNCVIPTCTMACCAGTCAPPQALAKVAESCATVDCVVGAYCGADDVCHALLPAGAVCDDPDTCDYDLGCVGVTPTMNGTCKALPALGEACPDLICAEIGAVCVNGTCVAAGLPGDPCAVPSDCSLYHTCDATLHCAPYPTIGMPCTFTCSDASYCNTTTRVCEAQLPNGSTCLRNDECATHYCQRIGTTQGTCSDVPLCF